MEVKHEALKIVVYRIVDNKRVGTIYIPGYANHAWRKKNLPSLFHAIQVLADAAPKKD